MTDPRPPVLDARNFSKTFSGRTVLREASLTIRPGEIHGLLGQNGSGKSTFIKILCGFHHPDPGASLSILGREAELPLDPGTPRTLGLAFVHQDLGLAESMSIIENLRVGRFGTRTGWRIPWAAERRYVRDLLKQFDLKAEPDDTISQLKQVERAMVAIIRALDEVSHADGGVLVLDEPTAYLPRDSVDRLFDAVRGVAAGGFGVLLVSHRLDEVREITDSVTVLRDGRVVCQAKTAALSERQLIAQILGRTLDEIYPEPHQSTRTPVLQIRGLCNEHVEDFNLTLHEAEIVGLTGLLGMGQEEALYALFSGGGSEGEISIDDRNVPVRTLTPRKAMDLGMALLPANRLQDGAARSASVSENVSLASLRRYVKKGTLRKRRERAHVASVLNAFSVTPPEPNRIFATLSGGNQQKALVGKWFDLQPRILLLHEPTQGVDVGARADIFRHVRNAADRGCAIVIASTEYEDLSHLCNRVIVFRDGRAVARLADRNLTQDRILEQCFADWSAAEELEAGGEPQQFRGGDPSKGHLSVRGEG